MGGAGAAGYWPDRGGDGGRGDGGGLYVTGGMVQVNQSLISGNLAAGGNGGDGPSIYEVTTYGGNGGLASGGGISVWGGSVQIRQSSIFDNAAWGGSGGLGTGYYDPSQEREPPPSDGSPGQGRCIKIRT